ncbi:thiol S-methyltransferase TMT1B-like isoform X2 [Haemaphysalis longicornis]
MYLLIYIVYQQRHCKLYRDLQNLPKPFSARTESLTMSTPRQRNLLLSLLGTLWTLLFLFFGLVLLVPLLFSFKARQHYFVLFYQFVPILFVDMDNARRTALSTLDSLKPHDPELNKRGALRLLEVGAGTGANFKHMKRVIRYTNVDPNREFGSLFWRELKRHPQGGRLIFIEHVAYPRGTWQRLLQDVVSPLWKLTACHCHLTRNCHHDLMKKLGFSDVTVNYLYVDMPIVTSRHAYGQAVA